MKLKELRTNLEANKITLSDAIVKALPVLKDREPDTTMVWLSNELQGYSNSLDFYYQANYCAPEYRIVDGSLKLMNKEGNLVNVEHPLADRSKYFLSVPVSWLEESATLPGELSVTEMPELSPDKNGEQVIVLEYSHKQLQNILTAIRNKLLELLK